MHTLAAASSEVAPAGAQIGVLLRGPTSCPLISHHAGPEAGPSVRLLSMPCSMSNPQPQPAERSSAAAWCCHCGPAKRSSRNKTTRMTSRK